MLYTEDNKKHFLKSKVKVFIYMQYGIWLIVSIIVFACNAQSVTAASLLAFARNTKFFDLSFYFVFFYFFFSSMFFDGLPKSFCEWFLDF